MLGNSIFHYFTILGNSIKFYFFCILQELRNYHRIFFRYFSGHFQEVLQFFFIVAYVHRSTRKYIRRTNQYRITHFLYETFHIFQTGKLLPSRLVDTQLVEHSRELITVFSTVDRKRRSSQDGH